MANLKYNEYNRLKNILIADKLASPSRMSEVFKMDILSALSSHMEVESESLTIQVDSSSGKYEIHIFCIAKI